MPLFSNIIAPLIAGLFFFLYCIYFTISNPSKATSYRYFLLFLIGISMFSLGRPLQLLLGPHPIPLIIVNIRILILCGLIAPVIILASDLFNRNKKGRAQTITIGISILLGFVYVVFNSLGTRESHVLFQFAVITAQDNLTPSMQGPYYSREVTIAVQVAIGLLLSAISMIKLVRLLSASGKYKLLRNKNFLFNSGIFIFALSFVIGSLAKQWGIYYIASIISALLFGGSVLIDIKEVYHYYEKLIPFIKEEIIHNVAFSSISKEKLADMLDCLGKNGDLNTFIIIKIEPEKVKSSENLTIIDEVLGICKENLSRFIQEDHFILLPLSNLQIGVALHLGGDTGDAETSPSLLEVLEDIHTQVRKSINADLSIGIGGSYEKLEDLRISYHEAINAQEFALRRQDSRIVHINSITTLDRQSSCYPVKEKEHLLSLVKVGDIDNSRKAFSDFIGKFKTFITEKPESLKVRLYEFSGSLIDAAIIGGGDEKILNAQMEEFFDDIAHVKNLETVEKWMSGIVHEIVAAVAQTYESRSKSLVKKALSYIETHFDSQLSYKDVAAEILISPSYFLSLFKQETGYTFVDYLTMIRIEKAKQLLLSTDMNINQIAASTGFNNSNYFSSVFRNMVGLRARDYRTQAVVD